MSLLISCFRQILVILSTYMKLTHHYSYYVSIDQLDWLNEGKSAHNLSFIEKEAQLSHIQPILTFFNSLSSFSYYFLQISWWTQDEDQKIQVFNWCTLERSHCVLTQAIAIWQDPITSTRFFGECAPIWNRIWRLYDFSFYLWTNHSNPTLICQLAIYSEYAMIVSI